MYTLKFSMKGRPYFFTKEEFENLVVMTNDVFIKPNRGEEEITLSNGCKLYIDVSYEPEQHAPCVGVVKKVPQKLRYNRKSVASSVEFKVDCELEVGDNAFFHFLAPKTCMSEGRWVEVEDDGIYFLIKYDRMFCAQRGPEKDVIMLNGWILTYPVEEAAFESKTLIVPDSLKAVEKPNEGIVAFIGAHVQQYIYQQDIKENADDVKVGDRVLFEPESDIPLQYELHRNFKGKTNFFRMQRKDIIGIVE